MKTGSSFFVQDIIGYRWRPSVKTYDIPFSGDQGLAVVTRDGQILDLQIYVMAPMNEWIEPANFEIWIQQRPTIRQEIQERLAYILANQDVDNDIHADKERIHG